MHRSRYNLLLKIYKNRINKDEIIELEVKNLLLYCPINSRYIRVFPRDPHRSIPFEYLDWESDKTDSGPFEELVIRNHPCEKPGN